MTSPQRILVASDHAGLELKSRLMAGAPDLPWVDLGTHGPESVDYPDYASALCEKMDDRSIGVLICGSGQGMAIKANRYPKIRAALCWSPEIAALARGHNNANVLCLGARVIPYPLAAEILKRFLDTPFEGGRHLGRVDKL